MVPKIINYIWLSDNEKPKMVKQCIDSWREVLEEYEIKEWTASDFDFSKLPVFVQEACVKQKWAFAADYLRLYILYNFGGIYLDSDIFMKKNIDGLLDSRFFSFIEYHKKGFSPYKKLIDMDGNPLTESHIQGFCIQSAFLGSERQHPFIKKCLDFYENRHFINEDGSLFMTMIAPDIYGVCAREFGFKYIDKLQKIDEGMIIYPSTYCSGSLNEVNKENYAIHCCAGSWREYGLIRGGVW